MKILSCYIENFGKLNKFSYDFSNGLNIIEEENGWGKSTFAAFIKAMFYGLEYRRGNIVTDRKRFMPWNGNKFGGYIIIEKDGTQYKIERFFGRLEKDDTLIIYDTSKNIITKDLGANPGETIWKLDRDSYEKTAFISLSESSLINDIISSKLGNINDQEADMETSTEGIKLLDDTMVEIQAKRGKGGLLNEKKNKSTRLKKDLKQYKNSLLIINEKECFIKKEDSKKINLENQINEIEDEQEKFILYEKKEQYLNLKEDLEIKINEHNKLENFFHKKSLSEDELYLIKEEAAQYVSANEQADKNKLQDTEKAELKELAYKFRINIPESFEIEECNKNITNLSNLRAQVSKYETSFEDISNFTRFDTKYRNINLDRDIISDYLKDFNQVSDFKEQENDIKIELKKLDTLQKDKINQKNKINEENMKKNKTMLFIGITIFTLGILLTFKSLFTGVGAATVGLIIVIISLVLKSKDKKEVYMPENNSEVKKLNTRLEKIKDQKDELESRYISFLNSINENLENIASSLANCKVEISEYNRLKVLMSSNENKKNEIVNNISCLKEKIELFLGKYFNILLINDYQQILSDLRNNLARFEKLSELQKSYEIHIKDRNDSKEVLTRKFTPYYKEFPMNVTNTINDLTKKHYDLTYAANKLKESKNKLDNFETENNVSEFEGITLPDIKNNQLAEDLREKKEKLRIDKNEIIRIIERNKKDINNLSIEADQIEDTESTISQLDIDTEELQKEYDLISLTKECMIEAKESLATKYIGSMSLVFKKYLEKLNNYEADLYEVDINLDVKIEHEGELYDSSELSKGMKDLVQLCMRMALVETVYEDVKNPILVLDDPFANLDNSRLKNSVKLLKEISLEYQIIYFICHNSRNLES